MQSSRSTLLALAAGPTRDKRRAVNGSFAVFLTAEAGQGAGSLNGDGDGTDQALQIYDAATEQLVPCTPTVGTTCVTGVRRAAEDFVLGEPTQTA